MKWDETLFTFLLKGWVVMQAIGKRSAMPTLYQVIYLDADQPYSGAMIVTAIHAEGMECRINVQMKIDIGDGSIMSMLSPHWP